MTTQLNQIIAIEKGIKSKRYKNFTECYKRLGKPSIFEGISRTYKPRDEEGETLPPESQRVKYRVTEEIAKAKDALTDYYNVTATKDWGNCEARADVVVDGVAIVKGAPVTYLLFLEKQANDWHSFIEAIPVLSNEETWHYDAALDCYATEPTRTVRNKNVRRNHVKAPATEHHPAQVEVYTEPEAVGDWTQIKMSGAMSLADKNAALARVEKLQNAIKVAREAANSMVVEKQNVAEGILEYIFPTA